MYINYRYCNIHGKTGDNVNRIITGDKNNKYVSTGTVVTCLCSYMARVRYVDMCSVADNCPLKKGLMYMKFVEQFKKKKNFMEQSFKF